MKIQTKVLIILLLSVLITGGVAIIVTQRISKNTIKKQIFNQLEITAKSRTQQIESYLESQKEAIRQLSQDIVIKNFISAGKEGQDYIQGLDKVIRRLEHTVLARKYIYDIFILDKNGIIVASIDKKDIGKNKSNDLYFLGGKHFPYIKDAYLSSTKINTMAFSAPVLDRDLYLMGVVAIICTMHGINEITTDRTGLGETGEIYLLNKDNYMITPSRFIDGTFLKQRVYTPESMKWLELTEEEEKIEREKINVYKSYSGKKVIGTRYRIRRIRWCLLAEISEDEAFAPVTRLTHMMLLILASLLVAGVTVSILISRRLTKPIEKLHKGIDEIMKGHLEYRVGTESKDEIGELSRSFDSMVEELKNSREELEKYSKDLEKKVGERTTELAQKVKEIERQRIATLSIAQDLEDVNKSLETEIAERKHAEEALRESEEKYRSLVENSFDGIFVQKGSKIIFTNQRLNEMLGYEQDELVGLDHWHVYHPDYQKITRDRAQARMRGEEVTPQYEVKLQRKDGSWLYGEINARVISFEEEPGVQVWVRDITSRKQAEDALKESEEKYRTLSEQSTDAIYITALNGELSYINRSFIDLFGYTKKEVTDLKEQDFYVNPEDRFRFQQEIEKTGAIRDFEVKLRKKDGTLIDCLITANIRKSAKGTTLGYQGVIRDITEKKKTEEALKESEAQKKAILDASVDRIRLVDKDLKILWANKTTTRELNIATEDLVGHTCYKILVYRDTPCIGCPAVKAIKSGQIEHAVMHQTRSKTTKGEAYWDDYAVPIKNESGDIVSIIEITRNITEQVRAEKELEQAKIAAEEASQAKSDFLANMSHEIRTPMNAIMGMTDLTLATELTKEQREYLEMVKMSSDSLLSLINNILDLSKIEARQLEFEEIDFDLRTTLENAAETLAVKADEAGLELACHIKPDTPTTLIGDPSRLRQIIVNLAGNAIKFTKEGEVVIRVEKHKEEKSSVLLHFMVSDTGIGIPSDKIETIFESFTQVDGSTTRKYGGTGLGLNICKQLVEMMDGRIWVESELDKGSTFHFTARFQLSKKKAIDALKLRDLDLSDIPVLIVDDNTTNRLVLSEMISSWGFVPTDVQDGEKALVEMERAFDYGSPYKLILLDFQMPGMDGFEVARRVKESVSGNDAKIILLTSAGQKGDASRCKEVGISGYLVKPVKQSDLFDAIMLSLGHPTEEKIPVITRYTIQETRGRLTILLAEDNIVNQKLAVKLLEKRGHRVVVASNGREAIEKLKGGYFDLILMDIQMPEMDGLEATRRIRNPQSAIPNRKIPIIAMTAHAMKEDRERCLAAGMDDYVSKPIKPEELFKAIEKFAERLRDKDTKEEEMVPASKGTVSNAKDIFDLSKALERVDGDKGLLKEIVDLFLENLPNAVAQIREALAKSDANALDKAAHSLKGSVGNFGRSRAYKAVYRLELIGKEGKLTEAEGALFKLEKELAGLEAAMKEAL